MNVSKLKFVENWKLQLNYLFLINCYVFQFDYVVLTFQFEFNKDKYLKMARFPTKFLMILR